MKRILPVLLLLLATLPVLSQQFYDTLIFENFTRPENFRHIPMKATSGKVNFSQKKLEITSGLSHGLTGVYHVKEVSGNFFAETLFDADDAVGLVLIASKNGKPDLQNYTLLTVNTLNGIVQINQYDCQNGVPNVHDPRKVIKSERYQARLDSTLFSLPFRETNKKIRILHESLSNTFHFYYGTRLNKWGITSNDWMEVAPQYSWLGAGQKYFVGLLCFNQSPVTKRAGYKYLSVVQTPVDDTNDESTGFSVRKRPFSWSGFDGEATVVTFGDAFKFSKEVKFVLWDRANNTPAWRLSNQHLLNFEFFECGDSIFPGCHEAMSDRQRHGQTVEVIEDNAVRKIIYWRGIPLNPQYNFSGEHTGGKEFPYYEEYWTFYPDGTGTRQFIEMPKLDTPHRREWGPEIIEPMPIGGSLVEAGDLCNQPALSVFNLTDSVKTYFPPDNRRDYVKDSWGWPQIVFDCHFKDNLPDFYMVYSQDETYPDTWSGIKIETQIGWHHTKHNFSHWPVGREPYGQNAEEWGATSRSYGSHPNEVTHTSLASAGFYRVGLDYNTHFSIGDNGRKYRKHTMLIGVSDGYDYNNVRNNVQTWLDPGMIEAGPELSFLRTDRSSRCLVFECLNSPKGSFIIQPKLRPVVNPAFQILNWKGNENVSVLVNGKPVAFKSAMEKGFLLVWINASLSEESVIAISQN